MKHENLAGQSCDVATGVKKSDGLSDDQSPALQWYAVRLRPTQNPGRRDVVVGGKYTAHRDRKGNLRKRLVPETGERMSVAEHLLRRAGMEVFEPKETKDRRSAKPGGARRKVRVSVMPGWLFVGWPQNAPRWAELAHIGAVSVLGSGGVPIRIAQSDMDDIMRRWGGKRHQRAMARRAAQFQVGDAATVVSGPFVGTDIQISEVDTGSVRAVLTILGRDTSVRLGVECLEGR